ncbi:hypothetical protein SGCZBJ_01680 [Caulobacter zeae]|uniref:histidine kinase n=1 Tax=Caulobacter zeae TaxID=2055137 RepID=A0A2N5DRJ6_9CAUL|nr:PAS domain-containing protein [Caulobacter zeae]PLR28686.1 hypothetical protein SGCZBJ_01680 [Caulobacter zeae]
MSFKVSKILAGGEVARLLEADGVIAGIGRPSAWPQPLRQQLEVLLGAAFPMFLIWGPERILIYNDAYRPILGDKHPGALGQPFWTVWPEVRATIEPIIEAAFSGAAAFYEDLPVTLHRKGQAEPACFTFSYSPIPVADEVPGVLCVCVETTSAAQERARREESERTVLFLDRLTRATSTLPSAEAVMMRAAQMIGEHMGVAICAYADMDPDQDGFTIRGDWAVSGSTSIVGRYRLADFGEMAVENLSRGLPLVINDNLAEIAAHEAATFQAIGIGATICMPLVRDGRLRALMAVHHKGPHFWTDRELALVREVTERSWAFVERVASQAELADSAAELRRITDAAPLLIAYIDRDERYRFVNRGYEAWFGRPREALQGQRVRAVLGAAYDRVKPYLEAALAGERVTFESRVDYPASGPRDVQVDYVPRRGADGGVVGLYAVISDVTERIEAERALLQSETRLRLATEFGEVGLWDVDNGDGALYWDDRVRALFGHSPGVPVTLDDFYGGLHHDDLEPTSRAYAAACDPAAQDLYDVEYRTIGAEDGIERWVAAKGRGVFDAEDRCLRVVGTAIDITARKQAEAARDLLMREVDHRARNALAIIQSIVRLTDAADPAEFRQAIHGRIEAMARAQSALARTQWRGGTIAEVVREELASAISTGARVRPSGGEIALPADQLQPLSMILHELATNATKYGALSVRGGRLEVSWASERQGWSLAWEEHEGPSVSAPSRSGFGSRLMANLARQLDGQIDFDWNRDGLSVRLRAGAPP